MSNERMPDLRNIAWRIWGGQTPEETLSKRYRLFVVTGALLIALFALYRLYAGMNFLPNTEWVIPVLVVTGSFSLYCGGSRFWRFATRYFGAIAVASAFAAWFVTYGVLPIHAFCWSGFVIVWMLSMRFRHSLFDRFPKVLMWTALATAFAIVVYDIWTGIIGHTLVTGTPLWLSFAGQIDFTLRHLTSLFFVPPLVVLAKIMVRVPVQVKCPVARSCSQHQGERR